jgi:hypothetical protein
VKRRQLLSLGLLATFIQTSKSYAFSDPGISAGPDFYNAFSGLSGVTEGNGSLTLHVVFAPWCHNSKTFYDISRPFLNRLAFNWIPVSGGQPEGRYGTEILLKFGTASALPQAFNPIGSGKALTGPAPLSDAQEAVLSNAMPLYWRDGGGGLATPSIIYKKADDRVRLVKGYLGAEYLEALANGQR